MYVALLKNLAYLPTYFTRIFPSLTLRSNYGFEVKGPIYIKSSTIVKEKYNYNNVALVTTRPAHCDDFSRVSKMLMGHRRARTYELAETDVFTSRHDARAPHVYCFGLVPLIQTTLRKIQKIIAMLLAY